MGRISVSRPHQSLFCSQDWEIKATIKQNNQEEIVQNDVSQALARHHPPNCTFLKVYMELSSYFLFLQEQIKDIIITTDGEANTGTRRADSQAIDTLS